LAFWRRVRRSRLDAGPSAPSPSLPVSASWGWSSSSAPSPLQGEYGSWGSRMRSRGQLSTVLDGDTTRAAVTSSVSGAATTGDGGTLRRWMLSARPLPRGEPTIMMVLACLVAVLFTVRVGL
jgi:hypothetical protein